MYAKIFDQILNSSLAENFMTRHVFMDLLVLSDKNGEVDMTHESIARRTNVPLEIVKQAIAELEAPDPRSRSTAEDGRRIVRLDAHRDWGWQITNYAKYREIRNEEARKEYRREWMRQSREHPVNTCEHPVNTCEQCEPIQIHKHKQKQIQTQKETAFAPPLADAHALQSEPEAKQTASTAKAKKPLSQKEPAIRDKSEKPKKQREPNPWWDAVCEHWEMNPVTPSELSRVGKIARDLKLKAPDDPEALPDTLNRRQAAYEEMFEGCAWTPEACMKHWDSLKAYIPAAEAWRRNLPTAEENLVLLKQFWEEDELEARRLNEYGKANGLTGAQIAFLSE